MVPNFVRRLGGPLGLLALAILGPARAESPDLDAVKSGFVYNFTKFMEWPAGALPSGGGTMQLCVAGQALDGRLNQLQGRVSQGREIRVRGVGASSDLSTCHVLFIGASEERRMGGLLGAVSGYPVLTISDISEFADYGGMIGLELRNDRVGFAINLSNARAAGLKPSAQLVKLGRVAQ